MTSGRDALHRIDAAIADARAALTGAAATAARDARTLADYDQRELAVIRAVAAIRLDHLKDDAGNGGSLGEADRDAAALIAGHDRHVAQLEADVAQSKAEIERLEAARRAAEDAHAEALAAHDAAAAATRARLDQDPEYRARASAVEQLNATAGRALEKLKVAREDRIAKGAPYEADPLFTYLQARGYGTRQYKAFPLFAMLDGQVARLIRFRDHKLNYDRLLELPERLAEHAARIEAESAAAEEALEALERTALERDGVGRLRARVGEVADLIKRIDADIDAAETRHGAQATALSQAVSGEAGPLFEAKQRIAAAMQRLKLPDLKSLAGETATLEDDRLVDSLVRLKRERFELEEAKSAAARALDSQGRVLSELEDVRRRFKSARFDSPYSEFTGSDLVGALVSQFLLGKLNAPDLWRRIERGHRTRRRDWDSDLGGDEWRDVFGLPDAWGGRGGDWGDLLGAPDRWSGGARKSPRPGPPRAPGGAVRPHIPRAPRPPSRPGGGFRTGGGF